MSGVLEISASGGIVEISFSGDPRFSPWLDLKDFWSTFILESENNLITVPIGDFYANRAWFHSYWISKDLELNQGPGLSESIAQLNETNNQFNRLKFEQYVEPEDFLLERISALGIKRSPNESQLRNIASMLRSANGANFSVPGAGKTATQIIVLQLLKAQQKISRSLIICPKSSFEAWLLEPEEVFLSPPKVEIYDGQYGALDTQLLVTNYEQIENEQKRRYLSGWLRQPGGSSLVVDEAHRVKGGPKGIRWRATMSLSSSVDRVDLLTGTPMPQSYEDLRNLFSISWKSVPRFELDALSLNRLEPGGLFVRTTKSQLALPETRITSVSLPMGPIQKQIYSALGKNYLGTLSASPADKYTLIKKGRAVLTLVACATNAALIGTKSREDLIEGLQWPPRELTDESISGALQSYMQFEVPPKYEWIIKFLSKARDERRKTLVWSSFVGNLIALEAFLKPFQPAVVYGGLAREDRAREIERFRSDPGCTVLLTNPQTLGEGISLHQTAHEAIFVDRTYNAAQYLQALDRIHRLGLDPETLTSVYILESQGSIDEKVSARLAKKITTLATMLDDPGLVQVSLPSLDETSEVDERIGFDNVDLSDLLAHLRNL